MAKIAVKLVLLTRIMGNPAELVNTAHPSISQATKELKIWAITAPKAERCKSHKVEFKIVFEDYSIYTGVYDLVYETRFETNPLKDQIYSYLKYLAGLYQPPWISDNDWKEIIQQFQIDGRMHAAKQLLENYDL